ncbi:MAG: cobaltochelatase subunit CobN, partial [Proteobacteria bacterium]|nr:cobaltochelatase subunit CobN [Pseudomonadota bacterium]
MGMKPVWDENNKVTGVEPIPGKLLGRPRIDVHLQSSGLFRDNFPNLILLLDEAVRQAVQLKDVENFIAKHSRKIKGYLVEKGYSEEEAENLSKIRVFSARPGSYGPKIEELIPNSGLWESDEEIADAFIDFVSFAYGKGVWGKPLKSVYKKNLEDVKITMHTRSSNLFGVLDTDGTWGYLGGLSLAVKKVSGEYPDVLLSIQGNPDAAHIEDIERTIGEELRARYLNPKWIEGMKKENYAGAWQMNKFVEYMWGWQVTTPFAIDETYWEQTYEVYVQDKYDLDLKEFFDENNPWAYQS